MLPSAAGRLVLFAPMDPALVDYVLYGTVIQEPKTSNIAREAAINSVPIADDLPAAPPGIDCGSTELPETRTQT